MKAVLIDYTGFGMEDPSRFAACKLIFAKETRVKMVAEGLQKLLATATQGYIDGELEYIANTIPGSWEMVDYTFLLSEVSRNFTHQLVRTRAASYAQQTMQILDVSGFYEAGGYRMGPSVAKDALYVSAFRGAVKKVDEVYRWLLDSGVSVEDARDILPCGIHTNIIVKMNLRALVDFLRSRIGPRNMGEMAEEARLMREAVLEAHPWTKLFMQSDADNAAEKLDQLIRNNVSDPTERNVMLKMVDRMRRRQ